MENLLENTNQKGENKHPQKETWTKPQVTLIGIKDETLGSQNFGGDLGTFS